MFQKVVIKKKWEGLYSPESTNHQRKFKDMSIIIDNCHPGMVLHNCSPCIWEVEVGGLWGPGQPMIFV